MPSCTNFSTPASPGTLHQERAHHQVVEEVGAVALVGADASHASSEMDHELRLGILHDPLHTLFGGEVVLGLVRHERPAARGLEAFHRCSRETRPAGHEDLSAAEEVAHLQEFLVVPNNCRLRRYGASRCPYSTQLPCQLLPRCESRSPPGPRASARSHSRCPAGLRPGLRRITVEDLLVHTAKAIRIDLDLDVDVEGVDQPLEQRPHRTRHVTRNVVDLAGPPRSPMARYADATSLTSR